jgi:hypothetical protein
MHVWKYVYTARNASAVGSECMPVMISPLTFRVYLEVWGRIRCQYLESLKLLLEWSLF